MTMRCSLLPWWLGISVVTSLLTCGCQHCEQSCPARCGTTVAAPPAVSQPINYAPIVPSKTPPIVHTGSKPALPMTCCGTTVATPPTVSHLTSYTSAVASDNPPIVRTVSKPAVSMTGAEPQPGLTLAAAKPAMAPST